MASGVSGPPRVIDCDVLIVGGGFAGCGAAFEARYWGRDLKVVLVEKAAIERSGAVAQGLSAINCYMGMRWGENQPDDFVRYVRNDLMGLSREDLVYDVARHVDSSVHLFEEWGLPIFTDPKTGQYVREGRWQVMIHGESYKPIIAEAARAAASQVDEHVIVTHLLPSATDPSRIAGAVGFSVRDGTFRLYRAKVVIVAAGGASHLFRPRSAGEGWGRTWYPPWSTGSAYALLIRAGAEMTQMENRLVVTRFKDGYGPVGAFFLYLKTVATNAAGENYEVTRRAQLRERVGAYADAKPLPTCLRNDLMFREIQEGRGPILMRTER
ncbi:MAG: FAD-binding protein, partial [Thermoplasmata archaeon]